MKVEQFSKPIELKNIKVHDEFWKREMELVRTEVIPYQWEALNDRILDAEPSYCMHNFRVAGKMIQQGKLLGKAYVAPTYTFRGFNAIPDDPRNPDDEHFYGFVFQDTDFSKWIEAVAYSLTQHPDPVLEKTADEAIDVVCAAQLDNGYLDTYYIINGMDKIFTQVKDHHELYCLGHLVEGAVAYYEATGKDKLLQAACRFADFVDTIFGPEDDKKKGYPGHEIAEMALVRLYQVTGNEKYLKLSQYFVLERGKQPFYFDSVEMDYDGTARKIDTNPMRYSYYQAHLPVKEQKEAVGHAVRAGYLYAGMADIARLTQDEGLYEACRNLWNSIVNEKLYITGGIGGTHIGESFSFPFDLPNDTAYSETCAAIALAFFARRMLEIEAKGEYGDVMELALYNTVLSGMALDGKSFFYVNPLEVLPEACQKDARKEHVKPIRQKWFGCACCPPNIARIVGSVAAYAYTENKDTLYTHLYMGSTYTRTIGEHTLMMKTETNMPWNGDVTCTIETDTPITTTFAFRIPSWCKKAEVSYKLPEGMESREEDGYLYVTGEWKNADQITLQFPMHVRLIKANEKVREDIGKVAVQRGPFTYCMEEIDNSKDLHLYQMDMNELMQKVDDAWQINEEKISLVETQEFGYPVYQIVLPGVKQQTQTQGLYSDYAPTTYTKESMTFVPYYVWNNRGIGEMSVWVKEYCER